MKTYLEGLYWQQNESKFNKISRNKELQKATTEFSRYEHALTARLEGEELELFLKSVDAADEMTANIAVDNFIDGTKVGAKLMIEILNELD